MSEKIILGFSLVSAKTLALVYHPILRKLSVALVSPYAKADMSKRAMAALADGLLLAVALYFIAIWDRCSIYSPEQSICYCEMRWRDAVSESSYSAW